MEVALAGKLRKVHVRENLDQGTEGKSTLGEFWLTQELVKCTLSVWWRFQDSQAPQYPIFCLIVV